jgi:hypothetical protein
MVSNKHVKFLVEHKTCPVHNQKPSIQIIDDQIKVKCCCSDFKITCLKKIIRLLIDLKDYSLNIADRSIA